MKLFCTQTTEAAAATVMQSVTDFAELGKCIVEKFNEFFYVASFSMSDRPVDTSREWDHNKQYGYLIQ